MLALTLMATAGASPPETCAAARHGPDACLPHSKFNVLSGRCDDSGSLNPVNNTCFTCYTGPSCSELMSDCQVFSTISWPLFFQSYWASYPCPNGQPVTSIPSDWGLAYMFMQHKATLLPELDVAVRNLHKAAGNVAGDLDDFLVLPGCESSHAIQTGDSTNPCVL